MDWPDSPFWDYSLWLYGRPGVEQACLELQRRQGLDVNLLLFVFWLADRGVTLDGATLTRAKEAVSAWHVEVVRPLRALRRRLAARQAQADPDSLLGRWPYHVRKLQKDVQAIELDGEHVAQLALTDLGTGLPSNSEPGIELACLNLKQFWDFGSEDLVDLRNMLREAFPEESEEAINRALRLLQA